MAGAVHCPVGSTPCFHGETVVQPTTRSPYPHTNIACSTMKGTFASFGTMPADFRDRLIAAIGASVTISPARKKNLLGTLG